MNSSKSRAIGCLYGQVIGDALGTRYEFMSGENAQRNMNKDMQKGFLPILGGGPFKLGKGQITDDSELALGMATSILNEGVYDKNKVALQYIKWYNSNPFDIGNTTQNALKNAANFKDLVRNSVLININSFSNGALMRCSPLAIYCANKTDNVLIKHCIEDCLMTHSNIKVQDACVTYLLTLKYLIEHNGDIDLIYTKLYKSKHIPKYMKQFILLAKSNYKFYENNNYVEIDGDKQGYMYVALQLAFYHFFNTNSFYDALLHTISQGGDTDTNACIVGSIMGAKVGVKNIPTNWINIINNPIYKHNRKEAYPEMDATKTEMLATKLYNM
jgi:ADP-ribosyl-[dinitrogen reductase] hydrolase